MSAHRVGLQPLDLFQDPQARPRWTGSRALVALPRDVCPECDGPLRERSTGQLPLLRGCGYGAVRTSVVAWCDGCGWSVVRSVTETTPR